MATKKKTKATKSKAKGKAPVKAVPTDPQPDPEKVAAAQAQLAVHRMAATYLAVPVGAIQSVVGVEGVQDAAKVTVIVSQQAMMDYQRRVALSDLRAREAVGK